MPSFFSTDVFEICNLFGFNACNSDDKELLDRGVNVHRIEFPLDVNVEVGAQCKLSADSLGMKSASVCNAGKSRALFVVIELVTSSEC